MGKAFGVISSPQVRSVLFDFAELSVGGAPLVQGSTFNTGIKFPEGIFIHILKHQPANGVAVTTTNNACTINFQVGATPVSNVNQFFYAGNQYLVLASNIPAGTLSIIIGGGAGDVLTGRFIYSFAYFQQKVS